MASHAKCIGEMRGEKMSELKLCQGTRCHQYQTKDRLKGTKGNKTYQTRRRSDFYYGSGNFCSLNCQNDWFETYGNRAIDHFGRLTEPKHLNENNAWQKTYDWNSNDETVICLSQWNNKGRKTIDQGTIS